MPERLIEDPVINSPFVEPARHFVFNDQGITNETAEGRRPSEHLVPIAQPSKRKGAQLAILTPDLMERRANHLINRIRSDVALWRRAGHPNVTPTTRAPSLYRTVSRPFAPPATGKIAVKVINHYGDEVMKVYGTEAVAAASYRGQVTASLLAADEADR